MVNRSRAAALVALAACAAIASAASLVPVGAQTVTPRPVDDTGVGKPPKGSGLGTAAALGNPKCNADSVEGFGVFSFTTVTSGPYCVAPAPDDNGGATARGVTADTVKVVVLTQNRAQAAVQGGQGGTPPKNEATGEEGTDEDAVNDLWAPYSHVYESWGREVEFVFIESSGNDEAAQRADAVAVKQEEPFIVLDITSSGQRTMASTLAADKYIVHSYGTTTDDTLTQAPYRWAQSTQEPFALAAAQFVGRQLVGRKVEYAGDDSMHSKPRTFGVVYADTIDIDQFVDTVERNKGKLAVPPMGYASSGSTTGDAETAAQFAPTMITRLKDSGVTSVVLLTDVAMGAALTKQATTQDYHPEWITTGFQYQDLALLARTSYDQDQWGHAFGLSNLYPYYDTSSVPPLEWYWGPERGTSSTPIEARLGWLAAGIHYAGPTLTVKNFQKGLFSAPASGGAASGYPYGFQAGYGKTVGLPFPAYFNLGTDFAFSWYDPTTEGSSQIFDTVAPGVIWYVNGARRYTIDDIPKQRARFFDEEGALFVFDEPPIPVSPPNPCTGCPSAGGPGTPSTA
jgi:hypothetical protein